MSEFDIPCHQKRALEVSATKALQDCEDEFDPFAWATTNGLALPECIAPTDASSSRKKQSRLIDDIFQTLCVNTTDKETSGDAFGWKTCQHPHRTELSNDYLERLRTDPVPVKSCTKQMSNSSDKPGKPAKPPKTPSAIVPRSANSPISLIGRSPESETCMRDIMRDREFGHKTDDLQAAPPTAGGYFSKAETYGAQRNCGTMKMKPKVYCSYSTGYKPKLHQFRHLFGLNAEEPFLHDMSPSYYIEVFRKTKNERRSTSTRVMQSVIKTKMLRSTSMKPAYVEQCCRPCSVQDKPVRINTVKFQEPSSRKGTPPTYSDSSYYDIEDFTDIERESLPPSRDKSRNKYDDYVEALGKPKGNTLDNLYVGSSSRRSTDMPAGLNRANLPQRDRKDPWKRKSSSCQHRSVGATPPLFRSRDGKTRSGAIMTGSGGVVITANRPSIPSKTQGFDCPTSVVAPAYYVSKPSSGSMKKKRLIKSGAFSDYLEIHR